MAHKKLNDVMILLLLVVGGWSNQLPTTDGNFVYFLFPLPNGVSV
jgi:hypothetical protein